METLALLLVFPLVWPFVAKMVWKHEITLVEMGLNLLVGALIVVAGWYGGKYAETRDVEILNGEVTSKFSKRVSCEHSYSCNCTEQCSSNSDGSRSCYTICQTCYEHPWDKDWLLGTNVEELKVPREDRRGTREPARWTAAKVGDPVAVPSSYTNYIKGAPDSLFNTLADMKAVERFEERVPPYPSSVHDLHYVNRVLSVGFALPEASQWNLAMAMMLRKLGPAKQVNTVIVLAKETDPEFATAIRAKWLGGKKNDVVVVLGTPEYPKLSWVRVLSWTDEELFKVQLRDALQGLGTADQVGVMSLIEQHIQASFVRRPMTDFEYLADEAQPPLYLLIALFLLSVGASVGLAFVFARNDSDAFRIGRQRAFRPGGSFRLGGLPSVRRRRF